MSYFLTACYNETISDARLKYKVNCYTSCKNTQGCFVFLQHDLPVGFTKGKKKKKKRCLAEKIYIAHFQPALKINYSHS